MTIKDENTMNLYYDIQTAIDSLKELQRLIKFRSTEGLSDQSIKWHKFDKDDPETWPPEPVLHCNPLMLVAKRNNLTGKTSVELEKTFLYGAFRSYITWDIYAWSELPKPPNPENINSNENRDKETQDGNSGN